MASSDDEPEPPGGGSDPPVALTADEKRKSKWRRMLGVTVDDWKAYVRAKPQVVQRRTRKGVPAPLRGYAWQVMSGGRELRACHRGVYDELVLSTLDERDEDIAKDISRTFPSHVFFAKPDGSGQRALYNVLRAYSVYDREVGYVQGMGFVAGLLLLHMPEEDAFWVMVALFRGAVHEPLEGLYSPGMPTVRRCLHQLEGLLGEHLPRLAAHFQRECVHASMFATQWFVTLFAYSLPLRVVERVWDVFMLEGVKVIFQVGVALLQRAETDLLALPFEVLAANLRHFPRSEKKSGGGSGGGDVEVTGSNPGGSGGDDDDDVEADDLLERALSLRLSRRLEELRAEHDYLNERMKEG